MNFRHTAILIGAVLVVGTVLLVMNLTTDDTVPQTESLTEELAGIKPDQIDSVEIERAGHGKLKIVRTDAEKKSWEIVEPYRVPAETRAVEAIIFSLMQAKPTIDPEPTSNLSARDLEPIELSVTLRQGTDKSSTVNIGRVTIGGNKAVVYVTTSKKGTRPIAVARQELEALFREQKGGVKAAEIVKWTGDLRTRNIFPGDSRAMGEDVDRLKLELPSQKKELILSRDSAGAWKFDSPAGWGEADADGDPAASNNTFTGVGPLMRTLTTMAAGSAADFIENPQDLKQYGLDAENPDRVRVEMKTRDGRTAVVFIGKTEGFQPPDPHSPLPPTGGKVHVMVEGQPGVIRVAASPNLSGLVPVIQDPSPLRNRNLITLQPRQRVDGVNILLAGQPVEHPTRLRSFPSPDPHAREVWMLYGGPNDPQIAQFDTAKKLIDAITAHRAIKDFPPSDPARFTAISATIFVWVNGFDPPTLPDPKAEPVQRGDPIKLEFGAKEGENVYVRRTMPDGAAIEFTVPSMVRIGMGNETIDLMAAIQKSRLDLLDPLLPTFGSDAAVKLTVTGQNNYTLEKDAAPTAGQRLWRFTLPEPKGRTADAKAVEELLRLLGTTQSVTRFVDEAPPPEKLAEYGFAPEPRLKVVVGLQGQERIYEFGKDAADPDYVYARIGGKSAVFTLPRLVFDRLAKPDLRDRIVFRFDPAKVTSIDLRGWGILKLGEQKLRFERNKEGIWVGMVGENKMPFATEPAKVDQFLRVLTETRAKTFITGNEAKPEYGLDDANYLIITLTLSEGDPITINFGAPTDGGASYFAKSSTLPQSDPFFIVDAAPLKSFKDGPAGFAK